MIEVPIEELTDFVGDKMRKAVEHMEKDFSAIRTGRAAPALVENLMIDYYGSMTRLKEIAGITVPEARLLVIQPWDPGASKAIEKAILTSDIGISPVNDGRVLRLPIPELSEERRSKLAKQVKQMAEDTKVAARNIRRDGNDLAKKAEKNGDITEDDLKDTLDEIQKLTDKTIADIDKALEGKEKELMTV